ncbi:MAG: CzcE family metal-binding protein [Burkholderiaceae bacterium]
MMNLKKKTVSMLTVGMLFAAMSVSAQAEKPDNWATNLPLSASSSPMKNTVDLYGNAIPVEAATRQITLTPSTKWINVTRGESVNFIVGGKSFAWNFYTLRSETSFDLATIAPKDINVQQIRVYVARNQNDRNR